MSEVKSSQVEPPSTNIFVINEHLTLKLEGDSTNIYVDDKKFDQCKYLLLNIPVDTVSSFDEIDSIDEASDKLDRSLEGNSEDRLLIPPETEYWGHCSNMQVWYEYDYDTRMLHRNLAFPLLRKLSESGDLIAKRVFKSEIAKRFESNHQNTFNFLLEGRYARYFTEEEIESLLKNPSVVRNIKKSLFSEKHYIRSNVIHFFWDAGKEGILLLEKLIPKLIKRLNLKDFYDIICLIYYNSGKDKTRVKQILPDFSVLIKFFYFHLFLITTESRFDEEYYKFLLNTITLYYEKTISTEIRHFKNMEFRERLREYYKERSYKFKFYMEEYDCVGEYSFSEENKLYYFDKLQEHYSEHNMYRDIKDIFFPEESCIVTQLQEGAGYSNTFQVFTITLEKYGKAYRYFRDEIKPILDQNPREYKKSIAISSVKLRENDFTSEERLYLLYLVSDYIVSHLITMRIVFIDSEVFHKALFEYYDKKGCDVEFKILEEDWIAKYVVSPRGKEYFYDLTCVKEGVDLNGDIFRELENIFFIGDGITITAIKQPEFEEDYYRIYIEKKESTEEPKPAPDPYDLYR